MKLLPVIAAISCITGLSLSSAQAAVVTYNEVSSGDLSPGEFFPPATATHIGTFEPGLNTVTGSTEANKPGGGGGDYDVFSFDISAGSQVTSVTYSYSNVNTHGGNDGFGLGMNSTLGHLDDWQQDVWNNKDVLNNNPRFSPFSILGGSLPLASGPTYTFDYFIFWDFGVGDLQGGTWDYTITFDVTPVPVPAAAWLFGSALFGLAGLARRQKA